MEEENAQHDATDDLEQSFQAVLDDLHVSPEQQEKIRRYLALLQARHRETYQHSLRVGILAEQIAHFFGLDAKALFYAGTLHDIGKSMTPVAILSKTDAWTPQDDEEIRKHVRNGHRLLQGAFDFSADVMALHHRFQDGGYPDPPLPLLHDYDADTRAHIHMYGRILALADVYDALHRVNAKFGEKHVRSGEEIRECMLQLHPDLSPLVVDLYRADIFTV